MIIDGPLLVLLPHPDDEFAVFPWLKRALAEGHPVRCVWITDGGLGGQDVQRRIGETRAALGRLGLSGVQMEFIGADYQIPDGNLHLHASEVLSILKSLRSDLHERIILIPALEGGHQDHDATHIIGRALARHVKAQAFQYPVYNGNQLRGPFFRVLSPLGSNGSVIKCTVTCSERWQYIRACFGYRSQWKSFVGLLPFFTAKMFTRNPFVLQPVTMIDGLRKPHSGKLLYERRTSITWKEVVSSLAELS